MIALLMEAHPPVAMCISPLTDFMYVAIQKWLKRQMHFCPTFLLLYIIWDFFLNEKSIMYAHQMPYYKNDAKENGDFMWWWNENASQGDRGFRQSTNLCYNDDCFI